jgi:hypothetical protein
MAAGWQYKYHMVKLSLPVPAEQEEFMQAAKMMREGNAEAQKKEKDQTSLQRINKYFCKS